MEFQKIFTAALEALRNAILSDSEKDLNAFIGSDDLPQTEEDWNAGDAEEILASFNGEDDYIVTMDTDEYGRPAGITITNGRGELIFDKDLNPEDYQIEDGRKEA